MSRSRNPQTVVGTTFIHLFIHASSVSYRLVLFRVTCVAGAGWEAEIQLGRSPVHQKTQTPFTHTLITVWSLQLTQCVCWTVVGNRCTPTQTWITCNLHPEGHQAGSRPRNLLLRGNSANNCTTVAPGTIFFPRYFTAQKHTSIHGCL